MSTHPSMLGPYPVERELGRGGMGVVYLGRDPRLGRPVAIKVLPEALANAESLARFDREAKLLASLNHPNIATIYGVEESNNQRLLVLEYIPGDTLAEVLRKHRIPGSKDPGLPIDEALDVCRQIALAIEAAHEGGVIHRDLKPGNVKITPDGQVKVLDFGLAKGTAVSDAELAHSPTMTFAATGMGVILGTAGYMSPEQARGKAVDRRTDVWSFGCVLFECLAGKQIFEGDTVSDTIARILEREPDWSALRPDTPPRVREILRRCLEKDLKKRQRDVGDVRIQIEEAIAERATSTRMAADVAAATHARRPPASSVKRFALAIALIVLGASAGIGLWSTIGPGAVDSSAGVAGPVRASIAVPRSIRAINAGITPDGRRLMMLGNLKNADGTDDVVSRLYTRRIDEYELKPVPGTDRTQRFIPSTVGAWVAVIQTTDQSTRRQIVKVPLDGSSPPVKIATMADNWGALAWLENGDFLVSLSDSPKYFRLPKGSDTPGPEMPFDLGGSPGIPGFGMPLPNDRGVLFGVASYNAKGWSVDIWVLDLATNKSHRLIQNSGPAAYSPTGHIVFSRGETLMAAPFDLDRLKLTGDVTALSRDLRINSAWAHGTYSVSNDGTLVFAPGGLLGADRRLVWVDAAGTVTPFGAERRGYEAFPSLSRDGRRVAVVLANEKGTYETWLADQDRPMLRRAIAIPSADCDSAKWSPNAGRLVYTRTAQDKDDGVYVVNGDGSGTPQLVIKSDGAGSYVMTNSWTPDGSGVIVTKFTGLKTSLWAAPVPASGAPGAPEVRPIRTSSYNDANGQLSPDGRFLAFESDESGKQEVYVATYGVDGALGVPLMVSSGGGAGVAWAGDSRRLFFGQPGGRLVSVTVDAKPALVASKPVVMYDTRKLRVSAWDLLPDGRLFAIQRSEAEDDITSFNIVFNWFDELRARMAQGR